MKTWTIGRRIVVGCACLIAIGLAIGGIAILEFYRIQSRVDAITEHSLPASYLANQMESTAKNCYAHVMEHVAASTVPEKQEIEAKRKGVEAKVKELMGQYEKLIRTADDRALFDAVTPAFVNYAQIRDAKVLGPSLELKAEQAALATRKELRPAFDALITTFTALANLNKAGGDAAGVEIHTSVKNASTWVLAGEVLSFVIGLLVAGFIIRSTNRILRSVVESLDESASQVNMSSGQVSSASQTLAEGASEQAASLEETSASLEEMASMCQRNAENAGNAKDVARATRTSADAGASDVAQMNAAMAGIKDASGNISKIIKTIDEIAFQTNILALNAAVEAARAGEAGMGFAVVADEVRNLAQRSADAAKETAEKIEDCIKKSEAGVAISGRVAANLSEIQIKASQVDELVAEIANASREQSQGIEQVNTALTQMDKVTQSNAASAEESASAAHQLNSQAQMLADAVEDLKALAGLAGKSGGKHAYTLDAASLKSISTEPARKGMATSRKPFDLKKPSVSRGVNGVSGHSARTAIPLEGAFNDF